MCRQTFSKNKQHIDFPGHGESDRVGHPQTGQHVVLVDPPAAHLTGHLHKHKIRLANHWFPALKPQTHQFRPVVNDLYYEYLCKCVYMFI